MTGTVRETVARGGIGSDTPTSLESHAIAAGCGEWGRGQPNGTHFVAFRSAKGRSFAERKATLADREPQRECHWADAVPLAFLFTMRLCWIEFSVEVVAEEHGCVLGGLFARFWKANWHVTDAAVGDAGSLPDGFGLCGSALRRLCVWTGGTV